MIELAKLIAEMMNRGDISLVKGEVTQGSPYRRCPDTQRIDSLMGTSHRVSLEIGVRETINYYIRP